MKDVEELDTNIIRALYMELISSHQVLEKYKPIKCHLWFWNNWSTKKVEKPTYIS